MQFPYTIPPSNCGGGSPPFFSYPCNYYPPVPYFPRKTKRKTKPKYYRDESSDEEDDYCPKPTYYPNTCTPYNPYSMMPMPFYPFPQPSFYPPYGNPHNNSSFSETNKPPSTQPKQLDESDSDPSDYEPDYRVEDEQENVSEIHSEEECELQVSNPETAIIIRKEDDCDSIPVNMIHLFHDEERNNNPMVEDEQSVCSEAKHGDQEEELESEEDKIECKQECKKNEKKDDGKITFIIPKKKQCILHGTNPPKPKCPHSSVCHHNLHVQNHQVVLHNKPQNHHHKCNHVPPMVVRK
jgi:hypothetical protein